ISHDLLPTLSLCHSFSICFFFFPYSSPPEIHSLSLHDALPISRPSPATSSASATSGPSTRSGPTCSWLSCRARPPTRHTRAAGRSEEHTSELQSRENLVCRLLLEKKKPICFCTTP